MTANFISNKAGAISVEGIEVIITGNTPNVLSPIMTIKVKRDYQAVYKFGKAIVELKDANDRLLPDDTILELSFSDVDATPKFRDKKLTPDYYLIYFHSIDQTQIENLQAFEPLDIGEPEVIVNENEMIRFNIRSPVVFSNRHSKIILYNFEIRKIK